MQTVFHKSSERGHAHHGWLNAKHSFSFANYHHPEKMHFGLLRVLNDDIIAPGMGFGEHPHDNMEIVTIPLKGTLEHKDSMGNIGIIQPNEVQAMSAGTGLVHSEYNHSKTEEINLLQIWIFPKEHDIEPRYEQKIFAREEKLNQLKTIVSPKKTDDLIWINQDASFSLGEFDEDKEFTYTIKNKGNGAYVFLIEGRAFIANQTLNKRDAIGIWDTEDFEIKIEKNSTLLVIDVPMH